MSGADPRRAYVLVTVAYNEAASLDALIAAVTAQTLRPVRWVLVSDGSTDGTDALMQAAAQRWDFIRYVRLEKNPADAVRLDRVSRAQARAMAVARELVRDVDYAFFGNLDADVTVGPGYFEAVIERCLQNPRLGIAGGGAYNVLPNGRVDGSGFVNPDFVGGPVQLFRRECLEAIGGYAPYGHADCVAVARAKMLGWEVRCFPDIPAYHHGMPGNTVGEKVPVCFRMGQFDYIMGGSPAFELLRVAARMPRPPYVLAGLALLAGYLWAWVRRLPIEVPAEVRTFMRREERQKLRARLRTLLRFGRRPSG